MDASLKSWLEVPADSHFSIHNLPFGIFSDQLGVGVGVALGEHVIRLEALFSMGYLDGINVDPKVYNSPVLNPLMDYGRGTARQIRERLQQIFSNPEHELAFSQDQQAMALVKQSEVEMLLPVEIGDYTDFYSSKEHATNVGTMFRDPNNALLPNWLHIPVGYHGRASSVIVSGVPIRRPKGQMLPADATQPVFGPCKLLDFELEMAFVCCGKTEMGDSIPVDKAEDHIWGMALFNDWSARDIQKWEYVPLGPFLGKNFASSLSPWIVTLDALEPFRTAGPAQDPKPLEYLQSSGEHSFDIALECDIVTPGGDSKTVCKTNFKYMYWNICQQLAHHTVNGCNINTGDLMASGTISGPDESSYGSMLEIAWRGTKPVQMPDGTERKFIGDGDSVVMRGLCEKNGIKVGFGEVRTKVLPAK